jgi:rhamnosyltransferase
MDPRGGGAVAVGITLFRPSPEQIARVAARARCAAGPLIAFENGGVSAEAAATLAASGVRLLSGGANLGIAAALNGLAAAAREMGARHLLLLDQDALPAPGMVEALAAARARLAADGIAAAVIGPRPLAGPGHKVPGFPAHPGVARRGSLVPVGFLATSGSLVDLAAFAAVGPFRTDYFIDGVDLEWCYRAWTRGYGCWLEEATGLHHHVGSGTIRGPFGLAMARQPLFRMATYLRNAVYGLRLPHLPARWKLRQAAYLPVQIGLYWADSGFRPRVLLRLLEALRDGLAGRLGPPRDLPGTLPGTSPAPATPPSETRP